MKENLAKDTLAILEILEENDRMTPEQIGIMLNMDPEDVKAKIKELEDKKIIAKYKAIINWEKATDNLVQALIEVKVTPERDAGFDDIAERIYRFPEVKSVFLMSGDYDLSVLVEGSSFREIAYFVGNKLAPIEHVMSCSTHFILRKYKEQGVIFDDKEINRRLAVSP